MRTCNCPPSKGELINRSCFLGSQIVTLKGLIPELEKQARKTPSKTLLSECKKVEQAKENLPKLKIQLQKMEIELADVKKTLEFVYPQP